MGAQTQSVRMERTAAIVPHHCPTFRRLVYTYRGTYSEMLMYTPTPIKQDVQWCATPRRAFASRWLHTATHWPHHMPALDPSQEKLRSTLLPVGPGVALVTERHGTTCVLMRFWGLGRFSVRNLYVPKAWSCNPTHTHCHVRPV